MRSISELIKGDMTVWFYLKDTQTKQRFAEELDRMGARYLNGAPVTAEGCSHLMSVHPDRRVAHLMIKIWNASFSPDFPERYPGDVRKIRKVDFARYTDGEEDYLCSRSSFTPVLQESD